MLIVGEGHRDAWGTERGLEFVAVSNLDAWAGGREGQVVGKDQRDSVHALPSGV